MGQAFGRATITVNGQVLDSENGAMIDVGGITRETQTTDQQSHYVESRRPAMVRCRVPLTAGLRVSDFNDMPNVSIQFQCDSGQFFVLANAWRHGALEVTGGSNGGVDLEFHSNSAEELTV
ncbi:MAG: phage tail tube protein [Pseudomonadota bacterium]